MDLKKIKVLVFIIFLTCCFPLIGQNKEDIILTNNKLGERFTTFLENIESKHEVKFQYLPEWFDGLTLKKDYVNSTLKNTLYDILFDSQISFVINYNYFIVFYKNPEADIERRKISESLKKANAKNQLVIGSARNFELGKEVTLTGRIRDVINSQPIIGASIYFQDLNRGTITDVNGYYSILLPAGIHEATFSYVNYESETKTFNVISDGKFNIELFESTLTLEDVTVFGESENKNVTSAQVGKQQMSIESIKELPAFLGEVDVIKSVQLLPGVTTVGEGASGFNVRGGGVDQNLVTLDGVQVFNYSHLLGFFSAFNPATVRDITLYRGGIPAEYGQRLSSILNVKMKDGNNDHLTAKGGIGLVSSNLMVEGPIIKDKTSFVVAGRSTYSDWFLKQARNLSVQRSSASFYDINGRITHKLNDKNKIILNTYLSNDEFRLANDTTFNWSTQLFSIKLNHLFNPTLVGNFVLSSGSYGYNVNEPEDNQAFDLSFKVKYEQLAATFEKFRDKHKIVFGFQTNLYHFSPGEIKPASDASNINPFKVSGEKGLESGVFLSDEYKISPKITLIGGVRVSSFSSIGEDDVLIYPEGQPRRTDNVIDTLGFNSGELVKTYFGIEPRFSMRYLLPNSSSIKLGYNRIYQYVHLVSNTTAVTPIDIWQSSNYHIKPQIGDQISLGYFRNIQDNKYEFSIEAYYKLISNILEYKNGAELVLNPNLETDLIQGEGRAYGVELLVKKNKGRLTGWGSYTFSRSENRVQSAFQEETISGGNFFPSNFNKPHDLTFATNYKISLRFSFNANFTYSTGRPITAPTSKYQIGDVVINNFSERNAHKIPDYHRLDLGLTIRTNHRKNKRWIGDWTISVYNVYGRRNAYSVFFQDNGDEPPAAKKLSILGTPFPAISYNFKFN